MVKTRHEGFDKDTATVLTRLVKRFDDLFITGQADADATSVICVVGCLLYTSDAADE